MQTDVYATHFPLRYSRIQHNHYSYEQKHF